MNRKGHPFLYKLTLVTMAITSPRLLLQSPSEVSPSSMLAYATRNEVFFAPWLPKRHPDFLTLPFQEKLLAARAQEMEAGREVTFYFSEQDTPHQIIGDLSFFGIIRGAMLSCLVGYKTDGNHLRQGYMREALQRGIDLVFDEMGLHRVEANIMPRNEPSVGLIKKLGFEYQGVAKRIIKINGVWEDHAQYVLLNQEID
ncbi:MAG: GNAT family protein [Bacteroidota bacterium]